MIKLINGDCNIELQKMIDKQEYVNTIITSPPYNMNLRVRNGKYCSRQIIKKEFSTKYSNFNDNLPLEEYYNFHKSVIEKLIKISDVVFYNFQLVTGNKRAFFKLIGDFNENIKEMIIWDKINAQPAMLCGMLNSQFEIILVLEKNGINRQFNKAFFDRGTLSNVWSIKAERKKNTYLNKATFPKELVEKIIINFTKKDDIICDPFMGTGTTGVVAKKLQRDFIGIELDKETYDEAHKNIKDIE